MKTLLMLVVAALTSASCIGQQVAPNAANETRLLTQLRSSVEEERAKAIEELRSKPAVLRGASVQRALLDLLDRENQALDAELLQEQNSAQGGNEDGEDEGFAEYYSHLVDTVDSFADWNDPRQACILVNASSSPDSDFAAKIAQHAKTTIPCLIQRTQSPVAMNRSIAVPVLVQALAKQGKNLDSGTIESSKQAIRKGLQDSREEVRSFTVSALKSYGDEDMVPMLNEAAKTDPAYSKDANGYWIRAAAAEAVTAIQERSRKQKAPENRP